MIAMKSVLNRAWIAALLIAVQVVAHAEPDRALFWSLQKEGQHAGYLLGTIHSEDPRVLDFDGDFLEKLNGNERFAMELVPDLPTLAKLAQAMLLPPGEDLETLIGIDCFQHVAAALADYGVPRAQLSRMKPWAAMMTLSVPPPKTGFFLDFSLSLRAAGNGLKVISLETLEEQLGFLEQMPMEQQIEMLNQAVAEVDQVQQVHDRMVSAYLEGDLEILQAETDAQLSELGDEAREFFIAEGIHARNHRMLAALLPALEQGTVFTAVGALHLPGQDGLIQLLRNSGYKLTPLPLPFGSE